MYEIQLPKNQWHNLPGDLFKHATDGSAASQQTAVALFYDDERLSIRFRCFSNPFTGQNTMRRNNEPLYNQEVFEVFIAAGAADPTHYLELEINPNNATWAGHIYNPTLGEGSNNAATMIPYNEGSLQHHTETDAVHQAWMGEISFPWTLIGERTSEYRLNFYRIVATKEHTSPDWVCDTETCDFLCWSPTMSGNSPAFHRPKRFGKLILS